MRFIIRWRRAGGIRALSTRPERLALLLQAAGKSVHYRRQQVVLPDDVPWREEWLPAFLARLPVTPLDTFLRDPFNFYNWPGRDPKPRSLELPIARPGRVALLDGGFEESATVRRFTHQPVEELLEFEPESLAGSVQRLCDLATKVCAGQVCLPGLKHAVIAFSGLKHGPLQSHQRDLLWKAFRVPVFDQFRGFSQELLAWECEAHDGMHIDPNNAIFEATNQGLLVTSLDCREYSVLRLRTGYRGRLETAICGCGGESHRVKDVEAIDAGHALAMAASASS